MGACLAAWGGGTLTWLLGDLPPLLALYSEHSTMLSVQLMLLELPPPSRPEKAAAVQLKVIAYCCYVVDCIVVMFRTIHAVVCID